MKAILFAFLVTSGAWLRAADEAEFTLISLENLTGKRLDSYAPDHPMHVLPKGQQTYGGVPFDMEWKLHLHGTADARDNRFYPSRITGIPVAQRAARLHLLHAPNFPDPEGAPVAALRLNYAGGTTHTIFVKYGVHTRDWWKHPTEQNSALTDTNSSAVWSGTSPDSERSGASHRFFRTAFDLPVTDKAIETIDVFSLFSRSSLQIFAMTVESPSAATAARKVAASEDETKLHDDMLLKVSDRSGNPVGGARVRGTALNERGVQTLLGRNTDALTDVGVVPMDFPTGSRTVRLLVSATGFVPAELELKADATGRLRREASLKLEPGERIGGVVQDGDGNPVAKAKVEISQKTLDGTGKASLFEYADLTTDAQGRWRTRDVPQNFDSLSFRISHKDFKTLVMDFTGDGSGSLTREALLGNRAQIRIAPGVLVAGIIQDGSGQPIADADISLSRPTRTSRRRTDAAGYFTFGAADFETATLTVRHPNFAPKVQRLEVASISDNLKIALTPGEPFKVRILEGTSNDSTNRQPVADATLTFSSLTNPTVRWQGTTDVAGRFVWEHAPSEPLQVLVTRRGLPTRGFTGAPGTNENEFWFAQFLSYAGRVVDAETKQPITTAKITPGDHWGNDRLNWRTQESLPSSNGAFVIRDPNSANYGNRFLVKVEAPGYWPQHTYLTNAIPRTNLFELRRGEALKGVVKLPDGKPATNAEIAAVGESYVAIGTGKFTRFGFNPNNTPAVRSDEAGRFELPLSLAPRVVVVHEQGYGENTFSNLLAGAEITLQSWGTIEGVVMVGSKPATNSEIKLNESRTTGALEYEYGAFSQKTDSEGKFRFTHVPPGRRWLVRLVPTRENSRMWSHYTPVEVAPGQVAKVTVGGTGRPIIGKVVPDDPARRIEWRAESYSIQSVNPIPLRPYRTPEEYRAWMNLPETKAFYEAQRHYAVVFANDGTFRADDIPAGKYQLNFYFYESQSEAAARLGSRVSVGSIRHEFEVPEMPSGRSDEPFDLGTLSLKTTRVATR